MVASTCAPPSRPIAPKLYQFLWNGNGLIKRLERAEWLKARFGRSSMTFLSGWVNRPFPFRPQTNGCVNGLPIRKLASRIGRSNATEKTIDDFIAHLGDRASKPITVITPRDVQSLIAKRQKLGLSAATVNIDAKILRAAFNRARRQGIIQTNPAEAVDLPEKHSVERGVFTPAEVKMLVDQAKDTEWQSVIMFGYYTGARLGDCTTMEWDKVDLANGTLKFSDSKNQKWVTVPFIPICRSTSPNWLPSTSPRITLRPDMAGLGPGGRHGLSEGFKRIMHNAGLIRRRSKAAVFAEFRSGHSTPSVTRSPAPLPMPVFRLNYE